MLEGLVTMLRVDLLKCLGKRLYILLTVLIHVCLPIAQRGVAWLRVFAV